MLLMPSKKKKKIKTLKGAAEAVADMATMGTYGLAKRAGSQMICERKGGRWVQGKCIAKGAMAKSEIPPKLKDPGSRTGKTKHSKPPSRSSY